MMTEYNNTVQDGPKKEEKLFKFIVEKQEEGALHFIQVTSESLKIEKSMNIEKICKLENDLKETRSTLK